MSDARTWKSSGLHTWKDSGFRTSCNGPEKESILITISPITNSRRSPTVNGSWTSWTLCLENEFKAFINDKWRARELKVIKNKNLEINVKDEFVEIFKNSKSISTSRGKTYFLARKQRAIAEEAKNVADEEVKGPAEEEVLHLKEKLDELSAKIHDYEQMEEDALKHKESLSKLYERGIINSDGEYVE